MSRRIIHLVEFDSEINRPCVLSRQDRDTEMELDEAREHRDDIESYDKRGDCLPDLSDDAPTFCLPGAGKPDSASTNSRDMNRRRFVYHVIRIRKSGAIHRPSRLTRLVLLLASSVCITAVYIHVHHMEQTRDQTSSKWASQSYMLVSQPRWWRFYTDERISCHFLCKIFIAKISTLPSIWPNSKTTC